MTPSSPVDRRKVQIDEKGGKEINLRREGNGRKWKFIGRLSPFRITVFVAARAAQKYSDVFASSQSPHGSKYCTYFLLAISLVVYELIEHIFFSSPSIDRIFASTAVNLGRDKSVWPLPIPMVKICHPAFCVGGGIIVCSTFASCSLGVRKVL